MNTAYFQQTTRQIQVFLTEGDFAQAHHHALNLRLELSSEPMIDKAQLAGCIAFELEALYALEEWDGFVECIDEFRAEIDSLPAETQRQIARQMMNSLAHIGRGTEIPEWSLMLCRQLISMNDIDAVIEVRQMTRRLLDDCHHSSLMDGFHQQLVRQVNAMDNEKGASQWLQKILKSI